MFHIRPVNRADVIFMKKNHADETHEQQEEQFASNAVAMLQKQRLGERLGEKKLQMILQKSFSDLSRLSL